MNVNQFKVVITPKVRLPFDFIKGTEAERFALAGKLTDDLFQKIKDLYVTTETDSCTTKTTAVSAEILEEKIKEILPKSLDIKVRAFDDKYKPSCDCNGFTFYSYYDENKTHYIISRGIMMPLTENKKVSSDNIYILLHEFRHIADYLTNPKMSMHEIYSKDDKFSKLFFRYINTDNKNFNFINRIVFNFKLNRQMKELSDDEKIDKLQEIRNIVKTEINAYSHSLGYQTMIDTNLGINGNWKTDKQRVAEFDFDRKLKFINKKLYRIIQQIRKQHAKELSKTENHR